MEKAIFCWSGGKDSSYCLHKVITEKLFDVRYLLSTVDIAQNRIQMHGVKLELIAEQAKRTGIELLLVHIPESSNECYEQRMKEMFLSAKLQGIHHVIFGDIYLEDLRRYRENLLASIGMTAVFPLWQMDTSVLLRDFLQKGFKAVVCCVNTDYLCESWVGRTIDESFVRELPTGVDPCGENGEFHTFCFAGPIFSSPIEMEVGAKRFLSRKLKTEAQKESVHGFWYCELGN